MIYDMQAETYKILTGITHIKLVAPDYPKEWNSFPMAIFRTKRKPHVLDINKVELQSFWTITIEVYEDSETDLMTEMVTEIDSMFKKIGFVGNAVDANTADLTRKICEYVAVVDNITHFVYQK